MTTEKIISLLPYTQPFLFVDTLEQVEENGIVGSYTYPSDAYFYEGHFINHPITPGVNSNRDDGANWFGLFGYLFDER